MSEYQIPILCCVQAESYDDAMAIVEEYVVGEMNLADDEAARTVELVLIEE